MPLRCTEPGRPRTLRRRRRPRPGRGRPRRPRRPHLEDAGQARRHAEHRAALQPRQARREQLGLDQPAPIRYVRWLGRAPDYKAAFLATLGANAEFYAPYQDNAKRWYKFSQERVPFINHAIIHPPVDRDKPLDEVKDVYMHVEEETDKGLIVSGAKIVATGSALPLVAAPGSRPTPPRKRSSPNAGVARNPGRLRIFLARHQRGRL